MSIPANKQFFTIAYTAENSKVSIFNCTVVHHGNKCHLQVVFHFLTLKHENKYEFYMLMQLPI